MNKEEIKEILEELENMYEISELEEQVNNINKIRDYIINLQQENKKYKEVIDKINNYIDNYDIFKLFSFPLMKRWEEEQVKSSIDYEFKISLIKDLKDILKGEINE